MFNVRIETIRERSTNGPTYMKGRNYYRNGRISQIDYDPDRNIIQALVAGTQAYQVRVILTAAGDLHDATCTCSAFSSYWGFCQHIAAVLLYCSDHYGREKTNVMGRKSNRPKTPSRIISNTVDSKQGTAQPSPNRLGAHLKQAAPPVAAEISHPSDFSEPSKNRSTTVLHDEHAPLPQDNQRKIRARSREFKHQLDRIIQLSQPRKRIGLKLKTVLHCSASSSAMPWLTFSMGESICFPVANVEQFAKSLALQLPLELDRNFTYDPLRHELTGPTRKLAEMIVDAFENDYKAVFATSHTAGKEGCLLLNPSRFARFLQIAGQMPDTSWQLVRANGEHPLVVHEDDLPLGIELIEDRTSEYIRLELSCGTSFQQMTASRNVFLVDGAFYLPSREHISLIEPLLAVFQSPGNRHILLTRAEAGDLVGQLFPLIASFCRIEIHPDVSRRIIRDQLLITAEMDLGTQGIRANATYHYGQAAIRPLKQEVADAGQMILRNYEAESAFEETMDLLGFKRQGSNWQLDHNQQIYDYLKTGRSLLSKSAQIIESEGLASIRVLPAPRLRFDLGMDEHSDDLILNTEWDGLNEEEQPAYYQALLDNRSWFQNRNGDFRQVDLDDREHQVSFFRLLELWDLQSQAASQTRLILPRFRALALSAIKARFLRIDESVHDMVSHLCDPARLSFRLPSGIKTALRPYQRHGFQWLCTLHHYRLGGILADDMGLGKTLQTIAFTTWLFRRTRRPSLIIAPTSLIYNWYSEFSRFVPDLPVMIVDGNRQQRTQRLAEMKNQACLITSYALLRRDIEEISEIQFASCFLDEAQNIKNPDTLNARSVKQVKSDCSFALTGTPIENRLSELWSIFDFIMPGYLLGQRQFQDTYESPIQHEQCDDLLEILHEQIRPFVLRRMKKDVLKELPDKIESVTVCDMDEEQRLLYETFLRQARQELEHELSASGYGRSQIYILALLTRLRQICCHPGLFLNDYKGGSGKLQLLLELLQESVTSGHRVLVFSQFTRMLELISDQWQQSGNEKPFYIDGQVPAEERLELVERFNSGQGSIFLISLRAGGTGLNLTGADTVIHYDPWWNPAVEEQATDRAYRIGQENVVQVFKLYARDSIEEKIMQMQQQKKLLMDAIIKPGQNLLSKMTLDEVKALFDS